MQVKFEKKKPMTEKCSQFSKGHKLVDLRSSLKSKQVKPKEIQVQTHNKTTKTR